MREPFRCFNFIHNFPSRQVAKRFLVGLGGGRYSIEVDIWLN